MNFRYMHVHRPDGTLKKAPFITVKARSKDGRRIEVDGLIDSGADNTVVPLDLAQFIGLSISGEQFNTKGIGGSVPVVSSKLSLVVEKGHESHVIDLPAIIMTTADDDVPLILGRNGFFEHFHITFKQDSERITLKKIEPRTAF